VVLTTIAVYGLFGFYATAALMLNLVLMLALMTALQATLTLPGIAGIVLTIGMAVDANVLIFERIREEVRAGKSAAMAIDNGYKMAFGTILDSNITTLVAGAILFAVGTGPIRGFAVTLVLGIFTSLFSAIMVTRILVSRWQRGHKAREIPL
jgi:preprotein translocase subunit SecD